MSYVLIMGDFNLPNIDFDRDILVGHRFVELIHDVSFTENVRGVTRWKAADTPSRLDCVVRNDDYMIEQL